MDLGPLTIDHVALPIYDPARSLQFYTQVLELPLLSAHTGDDWGGKPWLMMVFGLDDERQLVLCALRGAQRPAPGELPRDTQHFAFRVASDAVLAAWKERLHRHGVQWTEEDHGSEQSLYFEEPNGYVLELTTRAEGPSVLDPRASQVVAAWIEGAR